MASHILSVNGIAILLVAAGCIAGIVAGVLEILKKRKSRIAGTH